ncbi:MAG: hypothetical protein RQ801_00975 [Spirochaetaceae bacterium]|nr:hypothetical protein [Spirochaetaceae bacterium]
MKRRCITILSQFCVVLLPLAANDAGDREVKSRAFACRSSLTRNQ